MSTILKTCPVPVITPPSSWEQETIDLYIAFRESNNPISVSVGSAFDVIVKLAKSGGTDTSPIEFSSEFSNEFN